LEPKHDNALMFSGGSWSRVVLRTAAKTAWSKNHSRQKLPILPSLFWNGSD
jgi:hypothetical protein